MPTYTYKCTQCDHAFDTRHSITADPLRDCPDCQGKTLRRVISSAPGIAFKGSGFYVTDSRKETVKAPAKETSAPSSSEAPAEKKTESASDVKTVNSSEASLIQTRESPTTI